MPDRKYTKKSSPDKREIKRLRSRVSAQNARDRKKALMQQQAQELEALYYTVVMLEKKQQCLESENLQIQDENQQLQVRNLKLQMNLKNQRIDQLVAYCFPQEGGPLELTLNYVKGEMFWDKFLSKPEISKELFNLISDFLQDVPDESILC